MSERVLVCLGESRTAPAAIERFVADARANGSDVSFVHVLDPASLPAFVDRPEEAEGWREEYARHHCAPDLRDGTPVELRAGLPSAEILDVARALRADVVVLGWRPPDARRHEELMRELVRSGGPMVLVVPVEEAGAMREAS